MTARGAQMTPEMGQKDLTVTPNGNAADATPRNFHVLSKYVHRFCALCIDAIRDEHNPESWGGTGQINALLVPAPHPIELRSSLLHSVHQYYQGRGRCAKWRGTGQMPYLFRPHPLRHRLLFPRDGAQVSR